MKEFRVVIEESPFGITKCEKKWTTNEKLVNDYLEGLKEDSPITYERARKEEREV